MFGDLLETLKDQGRYWIVFTGDSITSCEWVHPNWRDILIYVLQDQTTRALNGDWKTAEWGIRGFNFAYDGSTTADIVNMLDDMLGMKPDLVMGLMGGNDPVLDVSVEESVKNIARIAETVLASGSQLVWSNSTPAARGSKKNDEYRPYAEAVLRLAEKPGMKIVNMFERYDEFETERFFTFVSEENPVEGIAEGDRDEQHPNQLGNAYIAKVMLEEVFGIEFDAEQYISETLAGEKYPGY